MNSLRSLLLSIAALLVIATTAWANPPGDFIWIDSDTLAQCDGTTDDTLELQKAFNAVKNGGTLVFPPGKVCLHRAELTLNNGGDFIIEGNGSTLRNTANSPLTGAFGGIRVQQSDHWEIRNLTLDGNRSARNPVGDPGVTHQLLVRASDDILLSNVRIVDSTADGFYFKGYKTTPNGADIPVSRVKMIGCSADGNYRNGMSLVHVDDVQIIGGFFGNTSGVFPQAGIDVETHDDEERITKVLISGVTFVGNAGNGIQLTEGSGGFTDNVRVVDNDFADNDRGGMRIRGSHATIQGNRFHNFRNVPELTQLGTILVLTQANDISIDGNTFDDIDTGLDVIYVEAGAERVSISGNRFDKINLDAEAGAAIFTEADETMITDNRFSCHGSRGIYVRGDRSLVDGNYLNAMSKNVILANADDLTLVNNVIGPLAVSGTSVAGESVIRTRASGGTVLGNSMVCTGTTQRGILIDQNPILVSDNVVENCDVNRWLQFLGGQGSTVTDSNVRATGTVTAPTCD